MFVVFAINFYIETYKAVFGKVVLMYTNWQFISGEWYTTRKYDQHKMKQRNIKYIKNSIR